MDFSALSWPYPSEWLRNLGVLSSEADRDGRPREPDVISAKQHQPADRLREDQHEAPRDAIAQIDAVVLEQATNDGQALVVVQRLAEIVVLQPRNLDRADDASLDAPIR